MLGGFVGQPIPGRRVASVTSIAAPIATTITVSTIYLCRSVIYIYKVTVCMHAYPPVRDV